MKRTIALSFCTTKAETAVYDYELSLISKLRKSLLHILYH